MDEAIQFWTDHPPHDVLGMVRSLLGENWLWDGGRMNSLGHHYWTFDYEPAFDLASIEDEIRRKLDEIEWQFVTISHKVVDGADRKFKWFGIAPILSKSVDASYHATRLRTIPLILEHGLLPSNKERQASAFPDTEGVIHVCETLGDDAGHEKGSAVWWAHTLSEKNCLKATDYGIVRIDMKGLVARVYQDMHSTSGLIVDRIDRIPTERIVRVG